MNPGSSGSGSAAGSGSAVGSGSVEGSGSAVGSTTGGSVTAGSSGAEGSSTGGTYGSSTGCSTCSSTGCSTSSSCPSPSAHAAGTKLMSIAAQSSIDRKRFISCPPNTKNHISVVLYIRIYHDHGANTIVSAEIFVKLYCKYTKTPLRADGATKTANRARFSGRGLTLLL